MKKSKILGVVLTIICLIFCFNTIVCATDLADENNAPGDNARDGIVTTNDDIDPINEDNQDGDHVHDNEDVHEGDLYIFQNDYVMDQAVDGNVFIFGRNVKITGMVNGSVFVCASKVEVDKDSYIACQLFVAAEEISINGMVLDVYSASETLKFGEDALIYRQIKASADNIHLSGAIGRDVNVFANKIENDEKLLIYGNLEYEAKNALENIDQYVEGEVKFTEAKEYKESIGETILSYVINAIATIIFDVLIYLALMFFAPKFIQKSKEYVSTKGVLAFAIGFAFIFSIPVIAFLLCLTGILSGVALFAIALYVAVLMINALVVVTVADEFIADKIKLENKWKKLLLVIPISLTLWAIRQIPFVGTLISAIVCLCGIGIVVMYQFDRMKQEN